MKPILKALLLADHVYEDIGSRKKIIAGTLSTVHVLQSGESASAYAYISITALRGPSRFAVRYVDLEDYRPLVEFELRVTGDDPLQTFEVTFPLAPLPTPHLGDYVLELLWEENGEVELMGSHRIAVVEATGEQP